MWRHYSGKVENVYIILQQTHSLIYLCFIVFLSLYVHINILICSAAQLQVSNKLTCLHIAISCLERLVYEMTCYVSSSV